MNIFALSSHPRRAARWHADKHVVKMILEYCQLLYTAHWALYYPSLLSCRSPVALARAYRELPSFLAAPLCLSTQLPGYAPSHIHHPCARWVRHTIGNYDWLCMLGLELAREYTYRYGKIHSCEVHLRWLKEHPPSQIPMGPRSWFPVAMDEIYRISDDPILCYQHYYRTAKQALIRYTGRHIPHWI